MMKNTFAVMIVAVLGILAALRIPVQMIPDLDVRTITVNTNWPGATPQDVEKEILIEQEEYLRSIPGLQRIISSSSFGRASIELEFPFGIDLNETLINVNNALSQVPSYPINVDEPRIYATSFSSNSFMYFRVAPLPGNPRKLDMVLMPLALVAILAMAAGACSDTGTDLGDPADFDPVATEQAVQDLQNSLDDDSDIMVSLGLAAEGLNMQFGADRVLPV